MEEIHAEGSIETKEGRRKFAKSRETQRTILV